MQRILLADDNAELRSALRLLLETRLKIEEISEANDMEQVFTQLENFSPHCIILDWELPGDPVYARISALKSRIPGLIIIVTNTRSELTEQVLAEGANAFVSKSDPPEKLLETLYLLCLPKNINP